ncbi:hypothetical protein B0A49_11563 [Cryomyces minteri]|uniref:V-SNARE coiled-coil homology domain-containing protein n=1 Tax=Cryomyces minteri TaxID=331657 RepID=A0A4U0VWP2_9PEZI|nr:hypothetical protein B0A49_11563 [Cryomyces minteri]
MAGREEPYDPYISNNAGGSAGGHNGNQRTAALQAEIDSTVGIMRDNINKVSERGARLDSLQDKTDNLAVSAQGFRRGANRMWWKDMKMRMCIIVGIIILLIVIIVPSGTRCLSENNELLELGNDDTCFTERILMGCWVQFLHMDMRTLTSKALFPDPQPGEFDSFPRVWRTGAMGQGCLFSDYRFDPKWTYGLPELVTRSNIAQATRISNPGCYATAAQIGIAPLVPFLGGQPTVFGVSGYSGAGTKPSPKNDVENLTNNLIPYSLTDHIHEREISTQLGTEVAFIPHVAVWFQGIHHTINIPLKEEMKSRDVRNLYQDRYAGEKLIRITGESPLFIQADVEWW